MYPSRHRGVQQQCELCGTTVVGDTLPDVIRERQHHLREEHPDVAYKY